MQPNIIAGTGERTFAEKYDLFLKLPMRQSEFVALLHKLHLLYEVCGDRATNMEIPPARHSRSLDVLRIQKCYQIYGSIDRSRGIGEMYRAYVDQEDRVVYIENAFSYTGP